MSKTIMVIDDSSAIRSSVSMVLKTEGYQIIEAGDGNEALTKLNGEIIDLFLCDVNMPYMDGITLLQTVKGNEAYAEYKFTPFVMLTTEAGTDMKAVGKESGAKAWLVKPFKPDALLETVRKILM